MAYGVTSSTLLLAAGVAPAAASAAVHFSEIGTTLVSGLLPPQARQRRLAHRQHHRGARAAIGAFAGATFLSSLPGDTAKPWVAGILLALGRLRDLAVPRPRWPASHVQGRPSARVPGAARRGRRRAWTPSAAVAGARSAPPRCSPPAGSSRARSSARSTPPSSSSPSAARSASCSRWAARASTGATPRALLVGGVIAAPFAAWLVRHLAARVLGVAAGGLIVLTNTKTIVEAVGASGTGRGPDRRGPRGLLGLRHRLGRPAGAPLARGRRASSDGS